MGSHTLRFQRDRMPRRPRSALGGVRPVLSGVSGALRTFIMSARRTVRRVGARGDETARLSNEAKRLYASGMVVTFAESIGARRLRDSRIDTVKNRARLSAAKGEKKRESARNRGRRHILRLHRDISSRRDKGGILFLVALLACVPRCRRVLLRGVALRRIAAAFRRARLVRLLVPLVHNRAQRAGTPRRARLVSGKSQTSRKARRRIKCT